MKVLPKIDRLPAALYRAEQVRHFDHLAIENYGVAGFDLMQRAGETVFETIRAHWPEARHLSIVCGGGNNAGDGFVVARLAQVQGLQVTLLCLQDPNRLAGDAKEHALQVSDLCEAWSGALPRQTDVIVDALLGTGLERPVEGEWADAVQAINRHTSPVISVDIPSGLSSDTGAVLGDAVQADTTVCFIGLKQGMFTAEGPQHCGEIVFEGLQVPAAVYASEILASKRLDWDKVSPLLQPRKRSGHKGDYGHVLLIGGDYGTPGAIRLAAEAAARSGAGLVSVATRPEHVAMLVSERPEVMTHGVDNADELDPLLARATVVAIGPGLGQSDWGQAMLARVLSCNKPSILDADALNLIANGLDVDLHKTIITPHPGEAARLLKITSKEIQNDRFNAALQLQERTGAVTVLKGSGTLIADSDHRISVCSAGNPGLASGGMGDVLTGIISALLAQGLSRDDAACAGVCIHALAADEVALSGERGMLASDLFAAIRQFVNP